MAGEVERFLELVRTLRAECPWDREQTHASLTRHLLEETYEVLDAIDHLDPTPWTARAADAFEEELGDLLFQVVFHSVLAAEEGQFTLADVARGIHDKLHAATRTCSARDAAPTDVAQLTVDWERRKVDEKGRSSVMDGIPATLPSLAYAAKVQKKAASQGVDWTDLTPPDDGLVPIGASSRWWTRPGSPAWTPSWPCGRAVLALADRYRAQEGQGS